MRVRNEKHPNIILRTKLTPAQLLIYMYAGCSLDVQNSLIDILVRVLLLFTFGTIQIAVACAGINIPIHHFYLCR